MLLGTAKNCIPVIQMFIAENLTSLLCVHMNTDG